MKKEYEFKDRIMGTDFIVSLVTDDEKKALSGYAQARATAEAYERRFSRFLADSELEQLNTDKDAVVSDVFWKVFLVADRLHKETNSVFNPLVQIAQHGYSKTFDRMEKDVRSNAAICYDVDWSGITANGADHRICLRPDQKLDFGGFLKGYVAEEIASQLKYSFSGIIINIGGDIFTHGTDEHDQPFAFSIWNPVTRQEFGHLLLKNEAVATSGTYKRRWYRNGRETTHIIDAATKDNPVTDLVSATVIAPHGHVAEAYATVAICLGLEAAAKLLDRARLRYVLIAANGIVRNSA